MNHFWRLPKQSLSLLPNFPALQWDGTRCPLLPLTQILGLLFSFSYNLLQRVGLSPNSMVALELLINHLALPHYLMV